VSAESPVTERSIEAIIDLIDVKVDAFATCQIAPHTALNCDPCDRVVVHFVLGGRGTINSQYGDRALTAGSVLVVPANLAKTVAGEHPIVRVLEARNPCPLEDGLVKFSTGAGNGLVLGCAEVIASVDGVSNVFTHLHEPMVENTIGSSVDPLFHQIAREFAHPKVGTRALVGALMKQILIEVFRSQIAREKYRAWLWPAMLDPQLARAALSIIVRPEAHHTVEGLAAIAGMSRSRFSETFTENFGRTPIEFVQAVRLRAARRMLLGSSLPIKAVAAAVGYSSRSHFSRAYQSYFGEAPSTLKMANPSDVG
jgi:AraC-like DNA-binding protein